MRVLAVGTVVGFLISVGCGRAKDNDDKRTDNPTNVPNGGGGGGGQPSGGGDTPQEDDGIVRGRWEIDMTAGSDASGRMWMAPMTGSFLASKGSRSQPISATVAEAVTFTVDTGSFTPGTPSDGVVSFGSLDVTALRDNALRVCGTNGNQRCTSGVVRIYTSGTPGGGLWSTVEGYGLPILTGSSPIGLGAASAVDVDTAAIANNQRVLKLSDFTTTPSIVIPISVDFSDAAAGSYSSTLVVEYVVN
jgi:hypothetical protein